jgi:anti-sigma B factor antagonist
MNLQIHSRETGGIVILDLTGELTLGEAHLRLLQQMTTLVGSGARKVILNLQGISKIDDAGAGALNVVLSRFRAAGGNVVLLNLDRSRIEFSGEFTLDEFEAYDSETDAINSFFPDRAVNHYDILEFLQEDANKKTG